jgi:hypothetical protein
VYTCQAKKKARLGIAISTGKVHLLVQVPKEKQMFEKFTDANICIHCESKNLTQVSIPHLAGISMFN